MLGSTMLRPFAWVLKTPAYPAGAFFGCLSLGGVGGGGKCPQPITLKLLMVLK